MDKNAIIQNLINSRKLSSSEEQIRFENALEALQTNLSIDDIDKLSEVFLDDTQDDETMFNLIHLMEQLRGEEYLKKIAICTPNMKDAHDWAMTLNKRIINSQIFFEMYINVINSLDLENKNKILALLDDVKNDNLKRFSEKIDYLTRIVRK